MLARIGELRALEARSEEKSDKRRPVLKSVGNLHLGKDYFDCLIPACRFAAA